MTQYAGLPPIFEPQHDPNAGKTGPWTAEVPLPAGITIIGTPTLTAVDAGDVALVGDTLVISDVAHAAINDTLWGFSFGLTGGTLGTVYRIRIAYTRSDGFSDHRTFRVRCGNN